MRKDMLRLKCPVCGKGYIYSTKHPKAGIIYVHKVTYVLYDEVIFNKCCIKR